MTIPPEKQPGEGRAYYDALISHAILSVLTRRRALKPPVVNFYWLGATEIDPANLAILLAYKDAADFHAAVQNRSVEVLKTEVIQALEKSGYPPKAINPARVIFTTQEDIEIAGGPENLLRYH